MQDERYGDPDAEPADEIEVQPGVLREHGVRADDGHGEGIDPCRGHEARRLLGVGACPRRMSAVLAADLPQLGFDPYGTGVAVGDDLGRGRDIRLLGKVGRVEHHRGEAEPHRLVR